MKVALFCAAAVVVTAPFVGCNEHDYPERAEPENVGQVVEALGWFQQVMLEPSTGSVGDRFGAAVSLSADTALIGMPEEDVTAFTAAGVAYIFNRSGTTWSEHQMIYAQTSTEDHARFGTTVALDGDVAVIGAPMATSSGYGDGGLAYVFTRDGGGQWSETVVISETSPLSGDYVGSSVAVSGDLVAAGASGRDEVILVERSGTSWGTPSVMTAASPVAGELFGASVAVDADTVIVGAPEGDIVTGGNEGIVYVFTRSGSAWTETQQLNASDPVAAGLFGSSVALAGDILFVGAVGANSLKGAAYVFTRSGTAWSFAQKLTPGGTHTGFGWSVDVAGSVGIVGAPASDTYNDTEEEAAYVYRYGGSAWTQEAALQEVGVNGHRGFGETVSVDGNTLLIGAHLENWSNAGRAYVLVETKADGLPCTDDGECTSTYCTDQVCCVTDSCGECHACNLSGQEGTCQHVASGTSCGDSNDDECTDADSCDGSGVCQSNDEPDGTACTGGLCQSGVCVASGTGGNGGATSSGGSGGSGGSSSTGGGGGTNTATGTTPAPPSPSPDDEDGGCQIRINQRGNLGSAILLLATVGLASVRRRRWHVS